MYNHKLQYKNVIVSIIFLIYVIFQSFIFVNNDYALNNISDEFGYISNAVFMAKGIKYSITGMWSAYYSYGYSIILSVFYMISNDFISVYRMAMLFNIICLVATYLIIIMCANMLLPKNNHIYILVLSLCVWSYSSNVIVTKWMWPEAAITLCYWVLCWTIIREIHKQKFNILNHVVRVLALSLLYLLHQRTLVVVIAYAIYIIVDIFIAYRTNAITKQYLFTVGVLLMAFLVCFFVINQYKQFLISEIYTYSDVVDINNYSGISSSIKSHISLNGIIDFLLGLCGKAWYFCVGTCFAGPILFICYGPRVVKDIIRTIVRNETDKPVERIRLYEFFVMLCLVGEILLTSLFMWGIPERHDIFIYGRYMEFTFGPVILLFLVHLTKESSFVRKKMWYAFVAVIPLCVVVSSVWSKYATTSYKSMFSSSVVLYFFGSLPLGFIPYLIFSYRMAIITSIMSLSQKISSHIVCIIISVVMFSIWTINSDLYNKSAYDYQSILANQYGELMSVIDDYPNLNVYLVCTNNLEDKDLEYLYYSRIIQAHLFDKNMKPVYSVNSNSESGIYLLSRGVNYDFDTDFFPEDLVIYENDDWRILLVQ